MRFNIVLLSMFLCEWNAQAQTPFSAESAANFLRVFSVEIGPRPMGSPNEQKAFEYALRKFKEFGLQEAYLMPMASVQGDALVGTTNTRSGIAVGVLRGTTSRIIVIGGHIDSAGPEIPGANDDASGSAVVLELARVLSKRSNTSTLVFCLFGGEEQGLRGSKYFVEHFSQIDRVVLMLQVDMANGGEWLIPLIDGKENSSPRWLVKASFEEFQKLGSERLAYPTDFLALNSLVPGGGIGSDHMPFLEKNIPAIDFTSDINDPIHTPQDSYELFRTDGLKRSGDLLYRLVERFDAGVPEEKTESYYFAHMGSWLLFVPQWLVRSFIVIAVMGTALTVFRQRRHRVEADKATRPKIPGLKIFLLVLIVQICVWSPELIVGWIKGVRYPWYADVSGYFILAGLGGMIGLRIALQVASRLKLSYDSYRYFLRSSIAFSLLVLLCSLFSATAAMYPAAAMLLLSAAVTIRNSWLKLTFWLFSFFVMYRLFFNEGFSLFARVLPEATIIAGFSFSFFWHLFLVVFFSVWAFPLFLGFASLYRESAGNRFWLNSFRQKTGIILATSAFLACVVWLATTPSYSSKWKQSVRVDQVFDFNTLKGSVFVRSGEYLSGAKVRFEGQDTTVSGWTREFKVKDFTAEKESWIAVSRSVDATPIDSNTTMNILTNIRLRYRPLSLTLTYSGGKHGLKEAGSALAHTITLRSISLHWSFFPDSILLVPVHFTVVGADSVTESIEATFVQPLENVEVSKGTANVATRTTLRKGTTFRRSSPASN
ncbi:MAG: M28 family peptidase [Ignavibacteriales bacterium]|nr:M28 family peptidase [Ignavibacteriales bacterium]